MMALFTGDADDARAAATMATSLSQYLMTAALAIIGAEAALLTAFTDKRERLGSSYFVAGLGLVATVLSIMFGGWAITAVYKGGLGGNWGRAVDQTAFSHQAESLLAGLALFLLSIILAISRGEQRKSP